MIHISCNSVEEGYYQTLIFLNRYGELESSRNGPVISCAVPATVTFHSPRNRVMLDTQRDANPFFHVMESIWMLAGRRDAQYVSRFVKRMESFSDDGVNLNGAYGYRWRHHFEVDQIRSVCHILEKDPTSRRAVIAMWDPFTDLEEQSKDLPCNTHIYFRVRSSSLNMTVCNRSNDAYWGLFGANAVHLSILHELIANELNLVVGSWTHVTNNLHVYPDNLPATLEEMAEHARVRYGYPQRVFLYDHRVPISFHNLSCFLWACEDFVKDHENTDSFHNIPFLIDVAYPMMKLWETRDLGWADKILDSAWRTASVEWVKRRQK
jgi:thymidylate synthase